MLDVYRLRLLRELDRRGTLAAVARALSYSPSAISQQLSQLEAETGVTLLEPVGRGVRLTPLARLLVTRTEVILERLEEAEAELRAAATEVRGTLRVASFQSVLFALIPSVLTQLAERHPGLRLEITHEQAIPAFDGLLAHEFDLVLGEEYPGVAFPPVTGARTQLLARDELFLVLPSHGPHAVEVAVDRPFRLADLARVPWVLDPPETAPGAWARNACREAGFEPDVRYAGSDLLFEILLAERGHAASVIPGMLLSAVPRPNARIQRIPGRPHRRLTTGVRAGAAGQPAIRALREALRQAVREASAPEVPDADLAARDPGVVRAHPGAAVEQFPGRVEALRIGLFDRVYPRSSLEASAAAAFASLWVADEQWTAADALGRKLLVWLLVAEGEDRGLDTVLEAELGEDAADVGLHRLLADRQVFGDLAVAATLGDQPEHVAFAGRERLQRIRRRRSAQRPGEPGEQLGAEAGGAGGGIADGADHVVGRGGLQQVGGRAGLHGPEQVLVFGGGGEHDHSRLARDVAADVTEGGKHGVAVQSGHVEVEQQDVGAGGGDDV